MVHFKEKNCICRGLRWSLWTLCGGVARENGCGESRAGLSGKAKHALWLAGIFTLPVR